MKNVIIIGASGSLAGYVIEELQKQKDVHLTLFLRNKNRLQNRSLSNTTVVEGDVMEVDYIKETEEIKISGKAPGKKKREEKKED